MGLKVAKFGGSSLSDADQFRKVKDILLSDPDRRFVVPSAPGRRFKEDDKVTDLLYRCFKLAQTGQSYSECFSRIVTRYCDIIRDLGIDLDLLPALPTDWTEGSFTGLVADGPVRVSATWRGGKLTEAALLSRRDRDVTVRCQGREYPCSLKADQPYRLQM